MERQNLSREEEQNLKHFVLTTKEGEKNQVASLFSSNLSRFQIAATHSAYVKDWERARAQMEKNLQVGILPPNISEILYLEMLKEMEKIMDDKLKMVQMMFEVQFGESIFNYLDKDGKKKKLFGIF